MVCKLRDMTKANSHIDTHADIYSLSSSSTCVVIKEKETCFHVNCIVCYGDHRIIIILKYLYTCRRRIDCLFTKWTTDTFIRIYSENRINF